MCLCCCPQAARAATGASRFDGSTLYTTLEPCVMCLGACVLHRVSRVVFAAPSFKLGACGGAVDVDTRRLSHSVDVVGGVLENESAQLLSAFFQTKRVTTERE